MKKRSSINKAEWSYTREEEYRKECEAILLKTNSELIFSGDEIYLKSETQQIFLLKIDKSKSKWYETWLKLKFIT